MSQPVFGLTTWGSVGTSTGVIVASTGPTILHTVNVLSSGTGTFSLYNATASSTAAGALVGTFTVASANSIVLDALCPGGLVRGNTTSTAEVAITWA